MWSVEDTYKKLFSEVVKLDKRFNQQMATDVQNWLYATGAICYKPEEFKHDIENLNRLDTDAYLRNVAFSQKDPGDQGYFIRGEVLKGKTVGSVDKKQLELYKSYLDLVIDRTNDIDFMNSIMPQIQQPNTALTERRRSVLGRQLDIYGVPR